MIGTELVYEGGSVWSGNAPHLRIGDEIRVGSTLMKVTQARLITHDGGRISQVAAISR